MPSLKRVILSAPLYLLLSTPTTAQLKSSIPTAAEYNTECKTCPRSLCPNVHAYYSYDTMNVTCWTQGTKIMGDDLWLRTGENCYVTQYDVLEYPGDYTTDLAYCGRASERWEQHVTRQENTIRWRAECRLHPELGSDVVAWLKEETDVVLTCWSEEGQIVIDDAYWLKTTQNCYVSRKHLLSSPDLTSLDHCGPIPMLEWEKHHNENGTSDVNKRSASPSPDAHPDPVPEILESRMYLINVTVGEEYAYCRSCAQATCRSVRRFEFNDEVWLQCGVGYENGDKWVLTTDFCYMNVTDFWQAPHGDCEF
ncbi:hypothetical protein M011DRAFT_408020 [Sporormia fimetaria CBS 119925]|uniref:Apple domain-containing protein n=1 Tax=Sporormia fimetaria CBS 119925 TaxID=1340428 RepID=A0A6A6V4A8_9PLEO|nr:hypothetical protein M011DRAFT_408020 [Sporormia fimetaria CBS 119925]